MPDKRHYVALTNGANMFLVAGAWYHNQTDNLMEFLKGAAITTSAAGAEALINTDEAHGLSVGDWVRVVNHRANTPQADDLIDPSIRYLVTDVPTTNSAKINLTTAGAGHGGYIGKLTPDLVRATNVEMILVSDFAQAPVLQQDRIG